MTKTKQNRHNLLLKQETNVLFQKHNLKELISKFYNLKLTSGKTVRRHTHFACNPYGNCYANVGQGWRDIPGWIG